MKKSNLPASLILFTLAYLAIATVASLRAQNWEFVLYIVAVVVFIGVTLWLHGRVRLSTGVLWALSIWGILHMIGGLLPLPEGFAHAGDKAVFYSWWIIPGYLKYDQIVHAFGFGTATWVCFQSIAPQLLDPRPRLGILTLCVLAGMGLGALNEVIEFVAVLVVPDTNVGGYENTAWDLVSNFVGCVIAALLLRFARRAA